MKWTEKNGNELEVSYMSRRMWRLLLFSNIIRAVTDTLLLVAFFYGIYWMNRNDIVVHLFKVLEGC
jgi:hypothetical protein